MAGSRVLHLDFQSTFTCVPVHFGLMILLGVISSSASWVSTKALGGEEPFPEVTWKVAWPGFPSKPSTLLLTHLQVPLGLDRGCPLHACFGVSLRTRPSEPRFLHVGLRVVCLHCPTPSPGQGPVPLSGTPFPGLTSLFSAALLPDHSSRCKLWPHPFQPPPSPAPGPSPAPTAPTLASPAVWAPGADLARRF